MIQGPTRPTRTEGTTSPPAAGGPPAPGPEPVAWSFIGDSSLPTHPEARGHEKRGRRWLVVSFLFCPCHVPLALFLVGALFGGSVLGAAITGNAVAPASSTLVLAPPAAAMVALLATVVPAWKAANLRVAHILRAE